MKKEIFILIILIIVGMLLLGFAYFYFTREGAPEIPEIPKIKIKEENLPPQAGLPAEVEAKRQAIYKAAKSGDYERLAALAEPNISYSFGGPYEGGFVGFLKLSEKNEGESALDIIPKLLELPYGFKGDIYVWPSVFYKAPKQWTEEDNEIMEKLVSRETIEQFRKFDGYVYYRLGITKDGKWIFYIAGD